MTDTFQAIVAARGYHVYRNITWNDAVPGQKVKVELEPTKSPERSFHIVALSKQWSISLT